MSDQGDKGPPKRDPAEHPTRPVSLEATHALAAQPRGLSETVSGPLGPAQPQEATVNVDNPLDVEGSDEPTRALAVAPVSSAPLETTGSLPIPASAPPSARRTRPTATELLGGRYRIERHLAEIDGAHLFLATDNGGMNVVARVYVDPDAVRHRPAWQRLRAAYDEGAPLPDLLRAVGVVPVIDLFEDRRHGPVVVIASLPGGTLSARAPNMSVAHLSACFRQIASVLMMAHAHGVPVGRITARDVVLDEYGAPHLDLSVPAFADALDIRSGQGEEAPSPSHDVVSFGRMVQDCLPDKSTGPEAAALASLAQDCIGGDPKPSAADIVHRLQTVGSVSNVRVVSHTSRWPALALLLAGAFVALVAGWVVGGGFSSPVAIEVADPLPAEVERALKAAKRSIAEGAVLEAGLTFRRMLDQTGDPRLQSAWSELQRMRDYRLALKDLKKRLAAASNVTPEVRRDIEMLGVLQPNSLVLQHWLGRLAENEGERR